MKPLHNLTTAGKPKPTNFVLQIRTSPYSQLYAHYLKTEFHAIDPLLKTLVLQPFCRDYYLKYPLEGLLRGICKKLMMNLYEVVLYGYFLSQVDWRLDHYIYSNLAEVFPNIIHVNEPTDPLLIKQLSMFLYFSSYAVKDFLNEDIQLIKEEMVKLFPEFEHLQAHWTSTQRTVGQVLNPRALNHFYRVIGEHRRVVDYNTCVDKILQISPCYDIAGRGDKLKEIPTFGFMGNNAENNHFDIEGNEELQQKIEDNFEDYRFEGDI